METGVEHDIETEEQFWDELDKSVSRDFESHDLIDDALRSYLALIASSQGQFVDSEYDFKRCSQKLHNSALFIKHAAYIRRQFVHCLLQEDASNILSIAAAFLLNDGRSNETTFALLNSEGVFPRLVTLITNPDNEDENLHRSLMELFYEMARIQKITNDDLACIDDDFIQYLFNIIEQVSDDVDDPYHYAVIRVLLVLNEQFMVAAHDPEAGKLGTSLTNKVIKVLSVHGSKYKTFGENIILLLNREDETSLQLLTLKLLYLLFTTPPTYEYFYTNDLRVLVDILVRNLLDLPEEASALRHTYLRVLYPLLEHTQLQHPPHYKRYEIQKLLSILGGGQVLHQYQDGQNFVAHFEETDETTKRLVRRCQGVSWLAELDSEDMPQVDSPTDETGSASGSPVSSTKSHPPALPAPRKLKKRNSSKISTLTIGQYLTPQLESARQSSLSMIEMAGQKEKPGVITPSRNPSLKHGLRVAILNKKEKPPPPKARRSGWGRPKVEDGHSAGTDRSKHADSTGTESNGQIHRDDDIEKERAGESKEEILRAHDDFQSQNTRSSPEISIHEALPQHQGPKQPPPAPKQRRWRGKRAKEEDEGGGGRIDRGGGDGSEKREPGKFNTNLPSIITTTAASSQTLSQSTSPNGKPKELSRSPFSPISPEPDPDPEEEENDESKVVEEKEQSKDESKDESKEKETVSHAVNEAQMKARKQISSIDIVTFTDHHQHHQHSPDDDNRKSSSFEESNTNENGNTNSDENGIINQETIQGPPTTTIKVILAPPNQAPPRSIPAPRWEIERSPFLSDETDSDSD